MQLTATNFFHHTTFASSTTSKKRNPFPEIIAGNSQEKPIFQNNSAVVLMNADPSGPGMALVVLKRNVPLLNNLTPTELQDVMTLTQQYEDFWSHHPNNISHTTHYNIWINDGEYAGQSVPQFHIQIAPATAQNPVLPGALRHAINPNSPGLPNNPEDWKKRLEDIYAPITKERNYFEAFSQTHGIAPQFSLFA